METENWLWRQGARLMLGWDKWQRDEKLIAMEYQNQLCEFSAPLVSVKSDWDCTAGRNLLQVELMAIWKRDFSSWEINDLNETCICFIKSMWVSQGFLKRQFWNYQWLPFFGFVRGYFGIGFSNCFVVPQNHFQQPKKYWNSCAWLTKGPTRPKHASNLPQKYSSLVPKDAQYQIMPMDLKSQILLQMLWLLKSRSWVESLDELLYICTDKFLSGL